MMLNDNWFVLQLDSHRCLQNGVSLYIILAIAFWGYYVGNIYHTLWLTMWIFLSQINLTFSQ